MSWKTTRARIRELRSKLLDQILLEIPSCTCKTSRPTGEGMLAVVCKNCGGLTQYPEEGVTHEKNVAHPFCPQCTRDSSTAIGTNLLAEGKVKVEWVCDDCGHTWETCEPSHLWVG